MDKLNLGIVGHGFVGKGVDYGFTTPNVNKCIIDPNNNTTIADDLVKFKPHIVFIAVPTPMGDDGSIDSSILEKVTKEVIQTCSGIVVIKSTVTPDILESLHALSPGRIVYNPEFLTEANANEDFINPKMHVFGGDNHVCNAVESIYEKHSLCRPCPVFYTTVQEASLIKYGINSFLATKVLWFNQFYDIVNKNNSRYNNVIAAISADPRIGNSHTIVPGFDGKRGYGGACFPKDTKALSHFAKEFTVLDKVIEENNKYRSKYELDDREKEQHVKYA